MWWRVMAAFLGALPATALGVMACMAVVAGSQGFATDMILATLFVGWGLLGVAGVVGLWLATLGRSPRVAVPLIVCGLAAIAPFVAMGLQEALMGELSSLLLTLLPFGVGVAFVVGRLRGLRLGGTIGH